VERKQQRESRGGKAKGDHAKRAEPRPVTPLNKPPNAIKPSKRGYGPSVAVQHGRREERRRAPAGKAGGDRILEWGGGVAGGGGPRGVGR